MNCGANIFDFLQMRDITYHVSDPLRSEAENLQGLLTAVKTECIDFAFVYWPDLDGLLHRVGNRSLAIPLKLRVYEQWIERLLDEASEHYEEVRLYIFSDHGMANCDELLDLKARIDALPVRMEKDYAVVYDSTMARFWFFNDKSRGLIADALRQVPQGRIVPDHELARLHCLFPDRYFGEMIFLVKEGVLIVPSHMGERPIRAMHGYHPGDKHSYAALLTNQAEIPDDIVAIPDIFKLMTHDAELAKAANHPALRRFEPQLAVPA
jgi:predicted AlkP superfamily pyrophosphatase or phosphodiesterase